MFTDLLAKLEPQLTDQVSILWDDRTGISIGAKRNDLVNRCTTTYSSFIDDDDSIAPDYIEYHLQLINDYQPQGIGFFGIMTIDGRTPRKFVHSASVQSWHDKVEPGGTVFYRSLNHWNVVRNAFRKAAPFPDVSFAEDHQQSELMQPLIDPKQCVDIISDPMYFYNVRTGISVTRPFKQ